MRSIALPDRTGCVQYAITFFAPRPASRVGRLAQRVGGVDHVVHDHAVAAFDFAMMFITSATLARVAACR